MNAIESPFPQFFDKTGVPLNNGKLYFGAVNQNPETVPVAVYWDAAGTQVAAQPIPTLNGYAVRAGTPAIIYATGDYSITVRNSKNELVVYAPNSADFSAAGQASADIAALIANLANIVNPALGAGMVGYNSLLSYPSNTVGNALTKLSQTVALTTNRTKPSGFSYVTGNIFDCDGPGLASHDYDAENDFLAAYASRAGANAVWVDPINGSDANPGNLNSPFRTIAGAMVGTSGLGIIWLLPAVYTDRFDLRATQNLVAGGTLARAVRIKAWGGPGSVIWRAPGQQPGDMQWVLTGGTTFQYEATPAGGELVEHIIFHEDGREVPIQYYASAAAANAVASGWFQDTGTKKIHIRHQNLNISNGGNAARLEIMYGRPVVNIFYGACAYLENITFRGDGEFQVLYEPGGFRPVIYARNCKWQYLGYHNCSMKGAVSLLQNCTSENSLNGDGWNYYNDPGTGQISEAIEVDCIGRNNGTLQYKSFDAARNKQGSSGHEGSLIHRVNGVYSGNYGQNIADTSTGAARSWMVGVICGSPYADLAPGGIGGYYNLWTEGTAWLDSVRAGGKGGTYGLYVNSGTANLFRGEFSGTIANTFGTTVVYNPA